MSDLELERVRRLMTEATLASVQRQNQFMSEYSDLMLAISEFWKTQAPDGTSLSPELVASIDAFRRRNFE